MLFLPLFVSIFLTLNYIPNFSNIHFINNTDVIILNKKLQTIDILNAVNNAINILSKLYAGFITSLFDSNCKSNTTSDAFPG